jgi:DNA-binding response OmpR family regulator
VETAHILVVEDDAGIAGSLVRSLKQRGYTVELETDGAAAAARNLAGFDLAVVDLGLPGKDGLELLRGWQGRSSTPVVVLTARSGLDERLQSFQLGAADFLAKPFFIEELLARIEARLGRTVAPPAQQVSFLGVCVDSLARTVTLPGGALAPLTAHEFNVLRYLVERQGRAVTRSQLAEATLRDEGVDARTVDSHVARLRKKLGAAGAAIVTIWGIGYSFRP